MPRNKLSDLNNHLFEMLEMLKEGDLDASTAKRGTDIATKIIEIKKVECMQANILIKAGYTDTVGDLLLVEQPKEIEV